jgi:hypothetical protein
MEDESISKTMSDGQYLFCTHLQVGQQLQLDVAPKSENSTFLIIIEIA